MNLPYSFSEDMRALLGEEDFQQLADAIQSDPVASIRLNDSKYSFPSGVLAPKGAQQIPWCLEGYYLKERLTYTFDPLFHAGCYYVQEASSMFLGEVMRQQVDEPVVALDLCAAPGGKTTHLIQTLPEGSLVVANEVNQGRARILADNVLKWGSPNVVVTRNDPADFHPLPPLFDVIVVDAPCSGEGMFRKDEVAVEEWSTENVDLCYKRQRRILSDIWPTLKPGGLLIYSTCTYNIRENEENVKWMRRQLDAVSVDISVPQEWNITGDLTGAGLPVYRFLPFRTQGEGFFMAVLRKKEDPAQTNVVSGSHSKKKKKEKKSAEGAAMSKAAMEKASVWCDLSSDDYIPILSREMFSLFPKRYTDVLAYLERSLHLILTGAPVGEWKGRDWLPAAVLPLSTLLSADAFPAWEVSYEQAVMYLRKEAFSLPAGVPAGYVLIRYKGASLGFMKNIGNRANNLYPAEYRIRSSYLPEEIKTL